VANARAEETEERGAADVPQLPQLYTCDYTAAGRQTSPIDTEASHRSLACPSYAKCDVPIDRRGRVFAVDDRVVAKVFGDDVDGLDAEMRAYGVLRWIHERNKEFKALDARIVMPTSPGFHAPHLLIERYTHVCSWRGYRGRTHADGGPRLGARAAARDHAP
jgi:hypothetical protein